MRGLSENKSKQFVPGEKFLGPEEAGQADGGQAAPWRGCSAKDPEETDGLGEVVEASEVGVLEFAGVKTVLEGVGVAGRGGEVGGWRG